MGCGLGCDRTVPAIDPVERGPASAVRTGAEVEVAAGFPHLTGKRVGLIVNQTARVGDRHLADLVAEADSVTLHVLFGPEHGIRGDADAGAAISDGVDSATGVPVVSLYGANRTPPMDILNEIDVVVFDIQDVGARFYTYISTMGLSMQAAAVAGVPFVVLDRPNPLGGERVDGFVLEPAHQSFVGQYPIPVQHGLTVGELATMIVGERWLPGVENLDLTVVPMQGWTRDLLWPETGLPWIAPSPNIPDFETALVYAGTCLFEAVDANEGRGTDYPFRWLGAPSFDPSDALPLLVSGLHVKAHTFTPASLPGRSTHPRYQDISLPGLSIAVTDPDSVRPLKAGITLLVAFARQAQNDFVRPSTMARLAGTERLTEMLEAGNSADEIVEAWADEVTAFRSLREPYLLYE